MNALTTIADQHHLDQHDHRPRHPPPAGQRAGAGDHDRDHEQRAEGAAEALGEALPGEQRDQRGRGRDGGQAGQGDRVRAAEAIRPLPRRRVRRPGRRPIRRSRARRRASGSSGCAGGRAPPRPSRAGRPGRAATERQPCWVSIVEASRPAASGESQASTSTATASAEPLCACIRRSTGTSRWSTCPSTATSSPSPPPSVSQPVSRLGRGQRLDDGERLEQRAGVEVGVAGVPVVAAVLAGGGDQPDREAALAQVDGDRRGGGDRGLERGGDALAAVRDRPGCRGRAWPATPRAAPRGAPSARRRAPSCASAPGAGRRRGGTRGP